MKIQMKKKALAVSMLLMGAGAAWASCGGTEPLVTMAAASLASTVVGKLAAATSSLVSLDTQQTNAFLSSLRIATEQVQMSGDKTSASNLETAQSVAAFDKELSDKKLVDKVMIDYMSQGYQPCLQSTATTKMALAEQQAKASVPGRIAAEVDAGGGRYASVAATVKAREEQHKSLFCTQDEVTAGACSSLGKIPGGDMNAALLYSSDTDTTTVAAKNAVINGILGLPDEVIPASAAGTPEAAAYVLAKKQKDAFLAWPTYSLKSIQADAEVFNGPMNDRVSMFFGSPQATQWAAAQASQATRGILVDLVKMKGLSLKLSERQLNQSLRMEANVASLLELERSQMYDHSLNAAQSQMNTEQMQGKVQ